MKKTSETDCFKGRCCDTGALYGLFRHHSVFRLFRYRKNGDGRGGRGLWSDQ